MDIYSSLYDVVKEQTQLYPHNKAIYYQGKTFSYRKFHKLILKTADICVNRFNIQKGDVVIIAQPNIPATLILFYALNKIGAIANLVHPYTPFNQMKNIIDKTNTKVAFLFEQRVAKEVERYREISDMICVTRIEDDLPILKKFVYHHFMNKDIRKKLGKFRGSFKGFSYLYKQKPSHKEIPNHKWEKDDIAVLLHSGSTTGDPKTICLANYNFNYICCQADKILCLDKEYTHNKMFFTVLPSFHGFGLCMSMHFPFSLGSCCMLVPKFSAKKAIKDMNRHNTFIIISVPTMFEKLLNEPNFAKSKAAKNLRLAYTGGDAIPSSIRNKFIKVMDDIGSNCRLYEGYGLTEAVAANCVNTPAHHKDGSIGYPIENAEFRIVDENGKELPRGEVGEITIKSQAVMLGYWKDEKATKEAIKDGWLYTGDLGHMDEDGYVYFDQRKKRVVKVSGVGVFPTEIEKLVESVPGVEAACAIQIPDPKMLHAIKVFVVAKYFDEQGMKNSIMDTCQKYLIRWAVPKEIEFVKELPYTLLGKVDFRKLQEEENKKRGISA